MTTLKIFLLSVLSFSCALASGLVTAAPPTHDAQDTRDNALRTVPLQNVKKNDLQDKEWRTHICALEGLECGIQPDSINLYRAKGAGKNEFYAIMPASPVLLQLANDGAAQWRLLRRWNFKSYIPARASAADLGTVPAVLEIYPALYPAGPGRWAVALISTQTEAYSGGGATFRMADFVILDEGTAQSAEPQRLFSGIPISCSKIVRACFSEKETKTSPHCHDESNGWLDLKFSVSATPGRYDWKATWHESSWPAHVVSRQRKDQSIAIALHNDNQAKEQAKELEKLPFCYGGPASE